MGLSLCCQKNEDKNKNNNKNIEDDTDNLINEETNHDTVAE